MYLPFRTTEARGLASTGKPHDGGLASTGKPVYNAAAGTGRGGRREALAGRAMPAERRRSRSPARAQPERHRPLAAAAAAQPRPQHRTPLALLLALLGSVACAAVYSYAEVAPGIRALSLACAAISFLAVVLSGGAGFGHLAQVLFASPGKPVHVCGQVSAIHYYPIKSCAGIAVSAREIDRFGFLKDRR